jgi:hypothetical protein
MLPPGDRVWQLISPHSDLVQYKSLIIYTFTSGLITVYCIQYNNMPRHFVDQS